MSIARVCHVVCDVCATPAPIADHAKEARALARRIGFVRKDGCDLCPAHAPAPSTTGENR